MRKQMRLRKTAWTPGYGHMLTTVRPCKTKDRHLCAASISLRTTSGKGRKRGGTANRSKRPFIDEGAVVVAVAVAVAEGEKEEEETNVAENDEDVTIVSETKEAWQLNK